MHIKGMSEDGLLDFPFHWFTGLRSDFLAVDWVGMNLYWVDGLLAQIVAVPLVDYLVRPQNYTVVLDEDLQQPSSLVLLPHRG
jgi:hypothetical protein